MRRRARGLLRRTSGPRLLELKLRAIDYAFSRFDLHSVADLGAVWKVDAGYSFYAAQREEVERVVVCDVTFTSAVVEGAERDPKVDLVVGYLGRQETVDAVGEIDAVLLFDILLHQVDPNWDQILEMYARNAKCLILAGPWWRGESVQRLTDLEREEFLGLVPFMREQYAEIYDKLDEPHPTRKRPWRDTFELFQWGITDAALRARMDELGFALAYHENTGLWSSTTRFDDCSYVFVRKELLADPARLPGEA
jgi:hypothetical protein